jgi:predicted glycosyltransferase
MPQHIPVRGRNVVKYKGFKELAYLHPNYFKPDEGSLREYGLRVGEYAFIREVSKMSTNYAHLEEGQLAGVCSHLRTLGLNVVLSLEDKTFAGRFAPYCTILEEPVRDIYSLMHFASFSISSGDTMARESCLAGTPVIYTGGRYMSVNTELIGKGIFFEPANEQSVMSLVDMIVKQNIKEKTRETVQWALLHEWQDTTEVIVNNVLSVMHKDQPLVDPQ